MICVQCVDLHQDTFTRIDTCIFGCNIELFGWLLLVSGFPELQSWYKDHIYIYVLYIIHDVGIRSVKILRFLSSLRQWPVHQHLQMSADKKQLTTATNCVAWKQFHPSRVFSRRNMWWFDKHFVGQSVVAVSSVPFSESIHPWIRRRARTLTHHNRFSWSCHWVNNTHVTRTSRIKFLG